MGGGPGIARVQGECLRLLVDRRAPRSSDVAIACNGTMSRRRRRSGPAKAAPAPAAPPPSRGHAAEAGAGDPLERTLRAALFGTLGLLLLVPLVVTPGTVAPFALGKALWARSMIEIAFALWVVLALLRPGYRPPRSWLLALMALGLGIALLAALNGAGVQRSLWSAPNRMGGVVDQAHWLALAVVLASALRRPREWRALLDAHLVVGALVAILAIVRASGGDLPFFDRIPERRLSRVGASLGVPTVLSLYMLANLVVATGLAVRAWTSPPGAERPAVRLRRHAFRAVIVALHFAGFVLSGSAGGVAGLCASLGFAAFAFAFLVRGRYRLAARTLAVVAALGVAALGARFFDADRAGIVPVDLVRTLPGGESIAWVAGTHFRRPSMQGRLGVWRAGLEAFAERPVLGWGPENFLAAYGRHATGYAAATEAHDRAHNQAVEAAVTTGAAGLAAWAALWGLALAVPVLAARGMALPERAFAVFAAAALAGQLAGLMFLFDTTTSLLASTVLLAFAARLEARALPERWRLPLPRLPLPGLRPPGLRPPGLRLPRLPLPRPRPDAALRRRGVRLALGGAAVALALAGLATNRAILVSADARYAADRAVLTGATARAIDAFPPHANHWRYRIFDTLTRHWHELRGTSAHSARVLLDWADREAGRAVRSEPDDWRMARVRSRPPIPPTPTRPRRNWSARSPSPPTGTCSRSGWRRRRGWRPSASTTGGCGCAGNPRRRPATT